MSKDLATLVNSQVIGMLWKGLNIMSLSFSSFLCLALDLSLRYYFSLFGLVVKMLAGF